MQGKKISTPETFLWGISQKLIIKKSEAPTIQLLVKRTIDIIGALTGIILTLPFLIIILFLFITTDSKECILFKQQRYGKNGRTFNIYKFRTMVINADELLKSNSQLYTKYVENNYKLEQEEDPRITKLGRFLRKTSLDELPQLLNVLKGEMSLVGPRPVVKEELLEYKHQQNDFLSVKPGMTGYWQISGRSNIGYPDRVDIELYYVYNQCLLLDIRILLSTILVVFLKKGAY